MLKKIILLFIILLVAIINKIDYKKNYCIIDLTPLGLQLIKKINNDIITHDVIISCNDKQYTIQIDANF